MQVYKYTAKFSKAIFLSIQPLPWINVMQGLFSLHPPPQFLKTGRKINYVYW